MRVRDYPSYKMATSRGGEDVDPVLSLQFPHGGCLERVGEIESQSGVTQPRCELDHALRTLETWRYVVFAHLGETLKAHLEILCLSVTQDDVIVGVCIGA
jgi:hypothetical protein